MGNDGEAMKWSLKKTFSKDDFNLKTQSRECVKVIIMGMIQYIIKL